MNFLGVTLVCHLIWEMTKKKLFQKPMLRASETHRWKAYHIKCLTLFFNILQSIEDHKNMDEVCEKRQFAYLSL